MTERLSKVAGIALLALGHLAATATVAVLITYAVMPASYVRPITGQLAIPAVWEMSATSVGIHVGLSACVWAFIVLIFKYIALHLAERKERPTALKLARGTVITETLIILPVFFLLCFGMAQLAISNIAGILANVAAYQAGRAAWVWKPEEDASSRRMGVSDGIAEDKCRIAVALVMLPVAPGEFSQNPSLGSNYANQMRVAAVGSHVPFGGTIADAAPELSELLSGALAFNQEIGVRNQQWMGGGLDSSRFIVRTASKFTHAYHASSCDIADNGEVTMTYLLQISMPLMGPIFGQEKDPFNLSLAKFQMGIGDSGGVGGRYGYFSAYTREFGLPQQAYPPNAELPQNNLINFSQPDQPNATDLIEGGVNDVDI